jgi:hypothetical protein
MLKKFLFLGILGGLLALVGTMNPNQTQPVSANQVVKLFVVSRQGGDSTNEIYRYEISGPTDFPTSPELTITDPGFDNIYGLAFSPSGELFVTNVSPDHGSGSVSRLLDPTGSPTSNGTITSSNFVSPVGAVFRNGELFIAQEHGSNVLRFVFDGGGNASFNGDITAGLCCSAPRGVAVNPASGELFVTQCCGVNAIHRYLFDGSGNATPNGVITGGGLDNPHDIVFSPWGEIFVANAGNSISRFTLDGAGNASSNGQITGNDLNGPLGLDFSPWGELFAANHFGSGGVSRWTFDASHNAIPNGSFSTPNTLSDLQFFAADSTGPDTTPPNIAPNVTCDNPGNPPWCKGTITVSWTITDPESPIESTSGCEPSTISNDTPVSGTTLTCSATSAGGTASNSTTVFRDGAAPTVSCSVNPNSLWPPNHKLASVIASVTVADALSGPAGFILTGATSSEPDNGLGDGDKPNDIQGFDLNTPDTSGQLRAERSGAGNGRIYTLTYQGTDVAGNASPCAATVTVPHDQGH